MTRQRPDYREAIDVLLGEFTREWLWRTDPEVRAELRSYIASIRLLRRAQGRGAGETGSPPLGQSPHKSEETG